MMIILFVMTISQIELEGCCCSVACVSFRRTPESILEKTGPGFRRGTVNGSRRNQHLVNLGEILFRQAADWTASVAAALSSRL